MITSRPSVPTGFLFLGRSPHEGENNETLRVRKRIVWCNQKNMGGTGVGGQKEKGKAP